MGQGLGRGTEAQGCREPTHPMDPESAASWFFSGDTGFALPGNQLGRSWDVSQHVRGEEQGNRNLQPRAPIMGCLVGELGGKGWRSWGSRVGGESPTWRSRETLGTP